MKIRQAFVANSSSSSFLCNTCEETFEGRDMCPTEVEHYGCENGHHFCQESLVGDKDSFDEKEYDSWDDENEGGNYVLEKNCPCCTFQIIAHGDMQLFLKKKYGVLESEVFAVVKEQNKRRKKLYPQEYVTYVCMKFNTNVQTESDDLRSKFKLYSELRKWA